MTSHIKKEYKDKDKVEFDLMDKKTKLTDSISITDSPIETRITLNDDYLISKLVGKIEISNGELSLQKRGDSVTVQPIKPLYLKKVTVTRTD